MCWIGRGWCVTYWEACPLGPGCEVCHSLSWDKTGSEIFLQVVLDCHPFFTALVIFFGWAIKTSVAGLVRDFIGAGNGVEETWLAYSIP